VVAMSASIVSLDHKQRNHLISRCKLWRWLFDR
jgi:hypothetical protein